LSNQKSAKIGAECAIVENFSDKES